MLKDYLDEVKSNAEIKKATLTDGEIEFDSQNNRMVCELKFL